MVTLDGASCWSSGVAGIKGRSMVKRARLELVRAIAAALAVSAAATTGVATAQTEQAPAAQKDESRIITPRRNASEARAAAAERPTRIEGPIDWAAVRQRIEATRARDAEHEKSVAAGANRAAGAAPPPPPGGVRQVDPSRLQSRFVTAARARATAVPLLVPATDEIIGTLKIFPTKNAYAATARLADGTEIDFLGTRMRVVGGAPGDVKARMATRERATRRLPDLDAPYVISRHEEGIDLSFSLFNAAYLVTVRCPKPDTDARCNDEAYVVGLVRRVALLNDETSGGGQ